MSGYEFPSFLVTKTRSLELAPELERGSVEAKDVSECERSLNCKEVMAQGEVIF